MVERYAIAAITATRTSSSPSVAGTPTAAHSATSGCSTTSVSTSNDEMFSPRRRIVSAHPIDEVVPAVAVDAGTRRRCGTSRCATPRPSARASCSSPRSAPRARCCGRSSRRPRPGSTGSSSVVDDARPRATGSRCGSRPHVRPRAVVPTRWRRANRSRSCRSTVRDLHAEALLELAPSRGSSGRARRLAAGCRRRRGGRRRVQQRGHRARRARRYAVGARTSSQNAVAAEPCRGSRSGAPRDHRVVERDRPELWNSGIACRARRPAMRVVGDPRPDLVDDAHGVMTAFDGPVVPDVNISEWMSRYSGPSRSVASSRPFHRSVSSTTTPRSRRPPSRPSKRSASSRATTTVVTSARSSEYSRMRPVSAVFRGTSTACSHARGKQRVVRVETVRQHRGHVVLRLHAERTQCRRSVPRPRHRAARRSAGCRRGARARRRRVSRPPSAPACAARGWCGRASQRTGAGAGGGGGTRRRWKKLTSLSSGGRPTRVTVSTSVASDRSTANGARPRPRGVRVEVEVAHRVLVRHLVDLLVSEVSEQRLENLGAVGPRAVGVREVGLPAHVVEVELVEQLDADGVVDEAAEHVLPEHLGGAHPLGEVVAGQPELAALDVLGALEEVRDPADVALGQRELQLGEPPPEVGPHEVAERVRGHQRREAHRNARGRVVGQPCADAPPSSAAGTGRSSSAGRAGSRSRRRAAAARARARGRRSAADHRALPRSTAG